MKTDKKRLTNRPDTHAASTAPVVEMERRALALPKRVVLDAERALTKLREAGHRASFSTLVEVGLDELLAREDLSEVLKRHGA
jgi:hypothetical protein